MNEKEFTIAGDKSISHRALILASQSIGKTIIYNLSTGIDVQRTIRALKLLGVKIRKISDKTYEVSGVGVGGLSEPSDILNMGNAGTALQLLIGLVSTYPFTTFFTGDASLRKRPLNYVIEALREMCVDFVGEKLPLGVIGMEDAVPIDYTLPVSSAQLKSAILLAALNTQGISTVIEKPPFCRDHTENMLQFMQAPLNVKYDENGNKKIELLGQPELFSCGEMHIPSDSSSAAFITAAALIVPGSEVCIKNVCVNPTRIGFYEIVQKMGGNVVFENKKIVMGEEVADIKACYSSLYGLAISPEMVPATIDEFPILSILAAYAEGTTKMEGLERLRTKESDRIKAVVTGLKSCMVDAYEQDDNIIINGTGVVEGGCKVSSCYDHRIAMSFFICNLRSQKPITVDNNTVVKTSFAEFFTLLDVF